MTKTPLFLIALAWCASAPAAPVRDVLLDDFGQPITSDNDAVLPPPTTAQPAAQPKAADKKPAAAPSGRADCSAEKKKLAACADDYLKGVGAETSEAELQRRIADKACADQEKGLLACSGAKAGGDEAAALIRAAIQSHQKNRKPAPKAEVAKQPEPKPAPKAESRKAEDRPPSVAAAAEPKVVAPPESLQRKFPQTIWVFSGPDEDEARAAKKAERPTILPPKIEKTAPSPVKATPPAPETVVKAEVKVTDEPAGKGDRAAEAALPKPRPVLPPKDETRFPLAPPERAVKLGGAGKSGAPGVDVPPASGPDSADGDGISGDEAAVPGPDEGEDDPKKDAVRVARVPPGAAPRILPPAPQRRTERPLEAIMPAAPGEPEDTGPVAESAPGDFHAFVDGSRIPKFIRINVQGYNVRKTPEFETGRKDNVDFQTVAGSLFAVTRVVPTEEGVATGIYVDGEERWVFMPWSRRGDFQFCESEACFADVAMGLDAIASAARIDPNDLLACGVIEPEPGAPVEVRPLPKRPRDAELTPSPRTKEELSALDRRVNHAPSVKVEYRPSGCVVDTRDRPKPNFRAFRSTAELRRAFIDYMTPFALEVQEATGLPAAVVIGQAALESGWGTSGLFLNTKNIFGHSCWSRGGRRTLALEIFGQTKRVTGTCDTPRPAYAGGYYMTFADSQDSVYAYAANLLSSEHNYYASVRAAVRRAKPHAADWREVVDGLRNYDAPNPAYRSLVRDIIVKNNLDRLETKKLCR